MSKKILVTGGCGYIGSHTLVDLIDNGFDVISADNNVNSDPSVLKGIEAITGKKVKNYAIDLADLEATKEIFIENPDLAGIIHFAARKSVAESVEEPLAYFRNNVNSLLNMLECMKKFKVNNFIFSSSCTVYGNPDAIPVTEETPFKPAESPYGRTKQMGEHILEDFSKTYQHINSISLRYFNPAGAHESALIGESSFNKGWFLVPAITETASGKRDQLTVNGTDYDTKDGSCIRDYIHVMDLANAHTKALQYLINQPQTINYDVFNLGIGQGVSVLEAIHAFEKVNKVPLNYKLGARRAGDVIAIYANSGKAEKLLGWKPKRRIEEIMATAWAWENRTVEV